VIFEERDYRLWLSRVIPSNPSVLKTMVKKLGSAKLIFDASAKQLEELGVKKRFSEQIAKSSHDIAKIKNELEKKDIWFLVSGDVGMPEIFDNFDDLPFLIYGIGPQLILKPEYSLGVVGSRKMTDYGLTQTKRMLSKLLEDSRVTVVSGMARGIDSAAHWEAVNAGNKTIAVLGNGVDICYPAQNKILYKKIIETGSVIISEYYPGTQPFYAYFPLRNRIIAALSNAVFVVEAGDKSGTLITAREALNYGKNLGVLPGRVDMPNSLGALRLIKDGAEPIIDSDDLRDILGMDKVKNNKNMDLETSIILNFLSDGPKQFDEIMCGTEINRGELLVKIEELVVMGKIFDSGTGFYSKI